MFQAPATGSAQGWVIYIQPLAPTKPLAGEPCNGCGVCCLVAPCPLGILLSKRFRGPCAALRWDAQGAALYRCGAIDEPVLVLQQALPRRLHFLIRPLAGSLARTAKRWIAAGQGCDSTVEVQLTRAGPTGRNSA